MSTGNAYIRMQILLSTKVNNCLNLKLKCPIFNSFTPNCTFLHNFIFFSIETTAVTKMTAAATALSTKMNLAADDAEFVETIFKDVMKLMIPSLNTDILEIQGALDISPYLLTLKQAVGAQVG